MTTPLQRAIAEVEKLPVEDQNAIAARLLAEVEDERQWDARFASTTDDQWDRLVAEVHCDVTEGGSQSIDNRVRQEVLQVLGELSGAVPALRLGQLLANLSYLARGFSSEAIWNIEDEE